MLLGFMIFMRGVDITPAVERVGLKVEPVLGPETARATASAIWAQNRQEARVNGPRNVNTLHKNHKAPRHIINRLINSYNLFP